MTVKLIAALFAVALMSTAAMADGYGEKDKPAGEQQEGLIPGETEQAPMDSDLDVQEGIFPSEDAQETTLPEDQPGAMPGDEGAGEEGILMEETPEAAVPRDALSAQGEITRIDTETGWMTLKTVEGADLQLHANPEDIQAAKLAEGQQVMAQYEMRGTMRHVTKLKPMGEKKELEGQKPVE